MTAAIQRPMSLGSASTIWSAASTAPIQKATPKINIVPNAAKRSISSPLI